MDYNFANRFNKIFVTMGPVIHIRRYGTKIYFRRYEYEPPHNIHVTKLAV